MKHTLLFLILLSFSFASRAQMITLFEAGPGAPTGVSQGFGGHSFTAEESGAAFFIAGVFSDTLKVRIVNETPGTADFWLTKRIPEMDVYAQLELFSDVTLPAGTHFTYSVSTDSVDWNVIPFADANTPVLFDNSAGNRFLRLNVHADDFDSVRFSFNYVSVKADTNFFVGLPQPELAFGLTAFSQEIAVATHSDEPYVVEVHDLSGQLAFSQAGKGTQSFLADVSSGMYVVTLRSPEHLVVKKCYFSR